MNRANAGKRRHRITLESPTITQSTTNGEKTTTWESEAEVWAAIEPVAGSGRETLIAKSFNATTSHRITILYRGDIRNTWRVRFGSRTFGIDGIITPDEIKDSQILYCTETIARGA